MSKLFKINEDVTIVISKNYAQYVLMYKKIFQMFISMIHNLCSHSKKEK